MKVRVHNTTEAIALTRESNDGRGTCLPFENVEVLDYNEKFIGLAWWIGVVEGHVFISGRDILGPDGEPLKAWQAMVKVTSDIVQFYLDDIFIHDAEAVGRHPNDSFLYFVRECGTHFVPLKKGGRTPGQEMKTVEAMMRMNSHFFHWNGRTMQKAAREKVLGLLKSHTAMPVYL